ncbi:sulfur oxidation c-type cytochrome SoxA [Arcobacter sp. CECT 8986]|uniref:sulfur oxidation c-type cytochrome SoxA n=1 Tax=Arcobacter sp. CECT 8986 TaxID=2044507 RepID=UPI001009B1AF|nr:sulfur oxidation c-type cytochrome SoxA [Arcobacter sp. CECT 8986]RXJ98761.1 sulfur oxidation c-type cytochrome SoxA [Arcobacter sp. CECT 8986]
MLMKLLKAVSFLSLALITLNASEFDKQAQKDKNELVKYFEAKFADPYKEKNRFFPYSTDDELENGYSKGLKHMDFAIGSYSYAKDAKEQYEAIKEFPPYEDKIEKGEELYNKKFANGNSLATCFPDPTVAGNYPYYDLEKKEVISLTTAVNQCLTDNGEKKWNAKKGDMAVFQAFLAYSSADEGKNVDIKIPNKEAQDAYERGKEYYYTQRGYLKMSCATCHVQGAGQRVRNEKLSPLLGQTTHFPVYRLKWGSLGTLERRIAGCIKDQGQVPPKVDSKKMHELLYFMAYMSNGMPVDGPDVRK